MRFARSAPRPGSLALRLPAHARDGRRARARSRAFFDGALVSPVLTAHPTEVRRKSTLTRELEIAELLDERDRALGDADELARTRSGCRRARPHPLAHQHAAPDAAEGDRRGRQRPLLLRLHLLHGAAAPLRRDRGRARRAGRTAPREVDPVLPAHRLVDRRRPRRQPVRHRRGAERGGAAAERPRARLLSRPAARARRRPVAGFVARCGQRGARRARRPRRRCVAHPRATSPTGARSPACIRASPGPRASSTMWWRSASRSATRRPTDASRNSRPIST